MNNAVFRKTMENVIKHRDINLVTTERRNNNIVSQSNHRTIKFFIKNLIAREMKKQRDNYELACLFRTFDIRIK